MRYYVDGIRFYFLNHAKDFGSTADSHAIRARMVEEKRHPGTYVRIEIKMPGQKKFETAEVLGPFPKMSSGVRALALEAEEKIIKKMSEKVL